MSRRFILPIVFSIAGILIGFYYIITTSQIIASLIPAYDLVPLLEGRLVADGIRILILILPAYFIIFIILSLPIALLMMIGNRIAKTPFYTQSIMTIGQRFGGSQMIRRALTPALFSLSFSELVLGFFPGVLFAVPPYPADLVSRRALFAFVEPLLSFFGALITIGVAIAIYSPTWLLNDSGIVSHLKPGQLEYRRCPDTEGVGKWYSNFVSGFALLAYPISVVYKFFFQKFVVFEAQVNALTVLESVLWIAGLPIMVMAFVLPVILLHEFTLNRTKLIVQSMARGIGAKEVELESASPSEVSQ
ncbi:MAG: hypothetical protein ACFE7R_08540 [Candidatus Hodarchaeota archaeon]